MSTKDIESLLRAKKSAPNYKRIVFYVAMVISTLLLFIFFVSLAFGNSGRRMFIEFYSINIETSEFFSSPYITITENVSIEEDMFISFPAWGLGTLLTSTFGFASISVGSSLNRTMLFDDKNWLSPWTVKGKISYINLFRGVRMKAGETRFYISKVGRKYKFRVPIEKGEELVKYGFIKRSQNMIGVFNRDELSSILHIIYTTVNGTT